MAFEYCENSFEISVRDDCESNKTFYLKVKVLLSDRRIYKNI